MQRFYRLTVIVLLVFMLVASAVLADGPVEITVYYSPTCDSCHMVQEQIIDPLVEEYGDQVKWTRVDVSAIEGMAALEADEARLGVSNSPLPVVVVGETLIASDDFFAYEDALVSVLASTWSGETASEPEPTLAPTAVPEPTAAPSTSPIYIAYVEKDGCSSCARASLLLEALADENPQIEIIKLNNVRDADLIEAMGVSLAVPDDQRLIAPAVWVGDDALFDDEITTVAMETLLGRYADGAPAYWDTLDVTAGQESIFERFKSMGILALLAAALVDGINPCAFATIIFFVSYLAISRKERSALLAVGLSFTAGVFVAYLLVGLGAMQVLKWVQAIHIVGQVLYGIMALGCFVLAGISISDYLKARRGELHDMSLNLPDKLRNRIKGRIRQTSGAFVGVSFVSGLFVSLLELACTGQVYLPTISFMVGVEHMRAQAVLYLVLYNLVFILPLLVVLVLAAYGISATRFQDWFVRNAARTKLAMVIFFLVLGAVLTLQVFAV